MYIFPAHLIGSMFRFVSPPKIVSATGSAEELQCGVKKSTSEARDGVLVAMFRF